MLNVNIVTPNGVILNDEFSFVTAAGDEGQIGILPNHIPLIMKISRGFVKLKKEDEYIYVSLINGILEQLNNNINVIAQDGHIGSSYEEAEEHRLQKLQERHDENKRLLVDFVDAEKELLKSIKEASKYRI